MELPGTAESTVVGLTLSGGGMRGIGHLGVIKALEESGLKPAVLSGSSAGAIIACFYSAGYSCEDIMAFAEGTHFFSYSNIRPRAGGWFGSSEFAKIYRDHFPENKLESLPIPVYVAATDVTSGRTEYFHEGDLSTALMATACIPMLFAPVVHNGKTYLDGGILNNLPIEPIKDKCHFLIGSHVNALESEMPQPMRKLKILDRAFHLALSSTVYAKAPLCNLFIDPPGMMRFSLFDKKKAREIFDYAYDFTVKLLASASLAGVRDANSK